MNWETPITVALWGVVGLVIVAVVLFAVAAVIAIRQIIHSNREVRKAQSSIEKTFGNLLDKGYK